MAESGEIPQEATVKGSPLTDAPTNDENKGVNFAEIMLQASQGGIRGEIKGNSGASLELLTTDHYLQVKGDNNTMLFAEVPHRSPDAIQFVLKTYPTMPDGTLGEKRHPDLYAKAFMKFALRYFKTKGFDITRVMSQWDRGDSFDYDKFRENYDNTGDPIESGKNTWAGKTLTSDEFGFVEIEPKVIDFAKGVVKFQFKKPVK